MIFLSAEHLDRLVNHAARIYPEECCGLLLGAFDRGEKTVVEVRETENSWDGASEDLLKLEKETQRSPSKRNRFSIAPEVLLEVQKEVRDRNLAIIGIYHSHPDCAAIPSQFDRAIAYEGYSYLIISVRQGKAADILSWTLDEARQFQPEEIVTTG